MQESCPIIRTTVPRLRPTDESRLGFGRIFTDHMFVMDYAAGSGWINARIEPYGPIHMAPSAMVLHYGQAIFEGLKAYRRGDGGISLFRPQLNFERMNVSAERLSIPSIDPDYVLDCLKQLLKLEESWVPAADNTSLYIRPFIFATDEFLGVRSSHSFKMMIILSPSGAYYPHGMSPVSIYIEDEYVRAVRGGMGFAKTAGNYAASIKAQEEAHHRQYDQVLWLDGVERRYVEEVGAMNVFFVVDDVLITPALNGSILSGITRRSVLELAADLGIRTEERSIDVAWLLEMVKLGRVSEAFGSGTAAVISPIGRLAGAGEELTIGNGEIGPVSRRIYDELTGIQSGRLADRFGWIEKIT